MRSDVLKRHMKQHSKKNESVPATNILVTNNIYNNPPTVSTSDPRKRSKEESESNTEELRKQLIMFENEYQRKLTLGKDIYKMIGEGIASYQALPNDMKEALNTYMEHQEDFRDMGNVELKPWQESLQLQKRNMVVNGNNKNQIMQNKNSDSDSDIDSQMSDY